MKLVVFLCSIFMVLATSKLLAQKNTVTISQNPEFSQLLAEKRKVNASITTFDKYKIQIFSGNSEESKKALAEFKNVFKDYDGTIVFHTPSYKVWVGSFKTRIEAEKGLEEIQKKYPTALLVKPNK